MTIVVDASVVAEVLLATPRGLEVASRVAEETLVAPQHLTAEFASVIRGWAIGGYLTEGEALRAFREFEALGVQQLDSVVLLPGAFELRHNLSAYDALYVALARRLGCPLWTFDQGVAAAAPDCAVVP